LTLHPYVVTLQEVGNITMVVRRDVNKDLTPKDKGKDKDLTLKDQDKDKDLKYVLKKSLRTRTRTRTTARQIILIAHINLSNVQW